MKQLHVILLALLILSGCGVCRPAIGEQTHVKDSTVLHIKDSTAIHYVPVEVPVPVEMMREIVPAQDSSHLETSVAESVAYIDTLGRLHHSLQNKKGATVHTEVPVEEHFHQEVQENTHEEDHQATIIEYIPRELTWWQKLWIRSGQIFWCLIGGALVVLLLRLFIFKR